MVPSGEVLEEGVPTAPLRAALQGALDTHFGRPTPIARLEHRPYIYRTSHAIEELNVWLEDGTALPCLFKELGRQALTEVARQAKPAFLHNPLREIETYRTLLAPAGLGTATFYGASVEVAADRYWLFLEKVAGVELYQAEFEAWLRTARWLAGMHQHFARQGPGRLAAGAAPLLRYDRAYYRCWLERSLHFLSPEAPEEGPAFLERLAGRYEGIIDRLLALPLTLIHGEFYASNVLVQDTPAGLRVCPVDWEVAAVAPGLIDLAAMTAGSWSEEERMALASAYHEGLADGAESRRDFLEALDCCHLHLAVQWLGWSHGWKPPREHAQNWLNEARRVARKLGLE